LQFPSVQDIQYRLIVDRRLTAILVGLAIGAGAALLGLLLAAGGPALAIGAVAGTAIGLYMLTDLTAALYATIGAVGLLPFATLPVKVALVPTVIDCAMGAFILVYLFQWMTGKRSGLRTVPGHVLILVFIGYCIFCFVAGLGNAALTPAILREFVELMLAVSLALILPDVARDEGFLRRITLIFIVVGVTEALIGLALYVINPDTAERILLALSRFGYPNGGVIRYIQDDPTMAERAVGTWVDPNAYGGFLMMVAALTGVQVLAPQPVTGRRWLVVLAFAILCAALVATISRGAVVALAAVVLFVSALRYRWLMALIILGTALLLALPFTQAYIDHFVQGVTGEDLSTQMRFGEIKDALTLIGRYPVIGVGFAGTPDKDVYLGVSMLYLKIAGATGLVGLALFLVTIGEVFRYGLVRWRRLNASPGLFNLWLGFTAGIVGALVSGIFDHYYFNIEFIGAAMMFWMYVGLSLAAVRIAETNPSPLPDRTI